MHDSPLSPTSADASRRKLIAMILAGGCFALLALAFLFGGKQTPVTKDQEKDPVVFVLDENPLYQPGSNVPQDWLNAPEGTLADSGSSTAPASDEKQESPVVAGDQPAPSSTEPQSPPTGGTPATPSSGKTAEPSHATQVTSGPGTTMAAAPPKNEATSQSADSQAQAAGIGTKPSSTSTSTAQPASGTVAAATTAPQKASSKNKSQRTGAPVFVRPKVKRPGLIAQTQALVTHEELAATASKSSPAATSPQSPQPKRAPAHVPQAEARMYAEQTTAAFRQQGALPPTQRVRLPRSTETTSKKIWREDDKPATADERRPFGLVVVDETLPMPGTIPTRTDIPAGTSPLEKNGADKPLWKRPE